MFCLHVCLGTTGLPVAAKGISEQPRKKREKKLYSGVRILEVLFLFVCFSRQGFLCVVLELFLELALVDQAGLELTEIHLPLPS